MKKIFLIASILVCVAMPLCASIDVTLADSNPTRVVLYSGSGFISDITVFCTQATLITINDTSTNTATVKPIWVDGNAEGSRDIHFGPGLGGSYIAFKKGIQVTATNPIFIRINIRSTNGAGGQNVVLADTTPSRSAVITSAGWISDIAICCSKTVTVSIFDTSSNAVMSGQPILKKTIDVNAETNTNQLNVLSFAPGSYIEFRYGCQITANADFRFLWINKRDQNGNQ